MPVATLSAAALPRTSSEWPRRQPMNTAIIVATTSATWFGPTAPASPNRKYDSATSRMRLATGMIASINVSGCGESGLCMCVGLGLATRQLLRRESMQPRIRHRGRRERSLLDQ